MVMTRDYILEEYDRLMAAHPSSFSDAFDLTIVLVDDIGVRMLLTRIVEGVQLDIEVTVPVDSTQLNNGTTEQCRRTALQTIRLLDYLVNLVDGGFSLSLIDTEFLWTASIILTGPPSDSMLELLYLPGLEEPD
ncbi:MAG: hypothetical protein ACFFFC_19320 [Candidatus Thorarchaeota archaeon]